MTCVKFVKEHLVRVPVARAVSLMRRAAIKATQRAISIVAFYSSERFCCTAKTSDTLYQNLCHYFFKKMKSFTDGDLCATKRKESFRCMEHVIYVWQYLDTSK